MCDDGIELNWIPPREPNGDIRHYIIKYTTQNGIQQEINTANNINYYNLTGLERGQTYNITVVAVNAAGGTLITLHVHESCIIVYRMHSIYVLYVNMYNHLIHHSPTTVLCPPPSLPPNTMVLPTLTTTVPPGATITIGCVDGYYTDREEILTCGSNGQWRGDITQCRGTNYTIHWISTTLRIMIFNLNCIID